MMGKSSEEKSTSLASDGQSGYKGNYFGIIDQYSQQSNYGLAFSNNGNIGSLSKNPNLFAAGTNK